jgi:hypothetical protein
MSVINQPTLLDQSTMFFQSSGSINQLSPVVGDRICFRADDACIGIVCRICIWRIERIFCGGKKKFSNPSSSQLANQELADFLMKREGPV